MRSKNICRDDLMYEYVIFENSDVYNLDTGKKIQPTKDKRRPNEPPIIYLKRKDGSREFNYHDNLIIRCFCDDYKPGSYIHHIDGDKCNCKLDNLMIGDGLKLLRDAFHETKEWKLVSIPETGLYYEYYICEDGRLFNATTGAFVKPFVDNRPGNYGNLRYNLYYGKSVRDIIHYSASRLVAMHFIPIKPEDADIVLFKDRDHTNLHYTNLFWGDNWDTINQGISIPERDEVRELTRLTNPAIGKEKWKPLEVNGIEFEFEYLVSNFGRVYNNDKGFYCGICNSGSPNPNNQYHKTVALKIKDDEYKMFSVHRLVAYMFCKNDDPYTKTWVNHINGNPECNWSVNLEWCTPFENIHHAIETNLISSDRFEENVKAENWRLNTLLAWIYSFKDITDKKAYKLYSSYLTKYNDNSPILSFDEFVNIYHEKMSLDKDFNTLMKFYKSEYEDQ